MRETTSFYAGGIVGRAQQVPRTAAPLRSLVYAAVCSGMSRTTSVSLPELIS
jgi:hypothetical protein